MKIWIFLSSIVVLSLSLLTSRDVLAEDPCAAVQHLDPDFNPQVKEPAYPISDGLHPLVVIDSAHHNFHTIDGRYKPFADILQKDGYRVDGSKSKYTKFSKDDLQDIDILVVSNALHEENVNANECTANWKLPTASAFDDDEINALVEWVRGGGSLMLLADHMPFAGAAEKLAAAFGITLINGYVFPANRQFMIEFNTSDGSLKNHPIVHGRPGKSEEVEFVYSFVGEAFWTLPNSKAEPLMVLGEGTRSFLLSDVKDFRKMSGPAGPRSIPSISTVGMFQGAALGFGKGRIVMLGEAGMFSAQLANVGPNQSLMKVGMNNPKSPQNMQFTLNIMHWLSGLLAVKSP